MPTNLTNLESESRGTDLLSYLKAKGLQVSPTSQESQERYANWSKEFLQLVQKELADYGQLQPTDVPADYEGILSHLTTRQDYPAGAEDQDIKKTEIAFRAMAQQLRSFYGREDQDDEVPFWPRP